MTQRGNRKLSLTLTGAQHLIVCQQAYIIVLEKLSLSTLLTLTLPPTAQKLSKNIPDMSAAKFCL